MTWFIFLIFFAPNMDNFDGIYRYVSTIPCFTSFGGGDISLKEKMPNIIKYLMPYDNLLPHKRNETKFLTTCKG